MEKIANVTTQPLKESDQAGKNFRIYQLDTFTSVPDKGNPTAVCYASEEFETDKMQLIARELALPVTAFIKKISTTKFLVRYFTPAMEIPACGHATLGAAAIVFAVDGIEKASFVTINNEIIESRLQDGQVLMNYPRYELNPISPLPALLLHLGLPPMHPAGYCEPLETIVIELSSPALLRNLQPDFQQLLRTGGGIKEVVVTSVSDDPRYDFLLRSFCPWIGIDEDPVTGSIHSVLAGFWHQRLSKKCLSAYQASPRGGEVTVLLEDDCVIIGGSTFPPLIRAEVLLP